MSLFDIYKAGKLVGGDSSAYEELKRNFGIVTLNGSETWTKSDLGLNNFYTSLIGVDPYSICLSSKGFKYTGDLSTFLNNYGYVYYDTNFCVNIDPTLCGNTAESFKAWLAQNPITVIHEIAAS